ncbi:MAG: FtsQ-type POTRA domain-containing protein [candidate division Zixibacteria bacterium]|jgi:cell division septal protein FtsQ|nr:FtsQ-type POTRA domain-containing protein [candidate division Zixibacteria bacterium]
MKKVIGTIILVISAVISARIAYLEIDGIPMLNLSRINIKCPPEIEKQTIINRSNLAVGQLIFKQDIKSASDRLLAIPNVEAVTINRRLPSTIDIQLETERTILLVKAERLYGLTEGQKLVEVNQDERILPLVTGIEGDYSGQAVINSPYYYTDQIKMYYAIKFYEALSGISPSLADRLSEIHFIDSGNAELYFDPHGLKVIMPARRYQQSLERLATIDNRNLFEDALIIDMSRGRMINKSGV